MKVIKYGPGRGPEKPLEIRCGICETTFSIYKHEWKKGTYGSEWVCKCPGCEQEVVRPGTEYRGDF